MMAGAHNMFSSARPWPASTCKMNILHVLAGYITAEWWVFIIISKTYPLTLKSPNISKPWADIRSYKYFLWAYVNMGELIYTDDIWCY
jgi:hypothetical protein